MFHKRNTSVNRGKTVLFRDAEHNNNNFESVRPTHPTDVGKFNLLKKIQDGVLTFLQSTTIHGVVYLAKRRLHLIER